MHGVLFRVLMRFGINGLWRICKELQIVKQLAKMRRVKLVNKIISLHAIFSVHNATPFNFII